MNEIIIKGNKNEFERKKKDYKHRIISLLIHSSEELERKNMTLDIRNIYIPGY